MTDETVYFLASVGFLSIVGYSVLTIVVIVNWITKGIDNKKFNKLLKSSAISRLEYKMNQEYLLLMIQSCVPVDQKPTEQDIIQIEMTTIFERDDILNLLCIGKTIGEIKDRKNMDKFYFELELKKRKK